MGEKWLYIEEHCYFCNRAVVDDVAYWRVNEHMGLAYPVCKECGE